MKSRRKLIQSLSHLTLFTVVVFAATAGYAQNPYWQRQADPQMVVIPVRSMQEITSDLDNAIANKQLAMSRNTQAIDRLDEIARSIQDREASIEYIDHRKDDAKDNKRESEAASLKIESKANKQAIDLLERLRDLRKAEIEVAKVEEDHADLAIRAFQMEGDLQNKRSEYNWQAISNQSDLTHNTANQVISELEVSLLKLQKELASSMEKLASKQNDVVKQRMKLHKAQLKLGM
jgi:hypothetical protein